MIKILLTLILGITSINCLASQLTLNISIYNNSNNTAKCSILKNGQYIPFIRLQPEQSKSLSRTSKNTKVRCHHQLTYKSTTALSYFNVTETGRYELLMEYVKCGKECKNKNFREATIIVSPSGDPTYNRLN